MIDTREIEQRHNEIYTFFQANTELERKQWIKNNFYMLGERYDIPGRNRMTIFEIAADQGHLAHLETLLDMDKLLNVFTYWTAVSYVLYCWGTNLTERFEDSPPIETFEKFIGESLSIAVANVHVAIVQRLLECPTSQCADNDPKKLINKILPLAVNSQNLDIIKLILNKIPSNLFSKDDVKNLIRTAINKQNPEVFNAIFTAPQIADNLKYLLASDVNEILLDATIHEQSQIKQAIVDKWPQNKTSEEATTPARLSSNDASSSYPKRLFTHTDTSIPTGTSESSEENSQGKGIK